jgi:uncharacterized integral membrane protein (TIGR00698 family)
VLPGLALAVLVGLAARLVHHYLPAHAASALGEVIFAVLIGLIVGNLAPLPDALAPGIRFSYQTVLRAAIVLLGAAFSFQQVLAIGGKALGMIVILMVLALATAYFLGRLAGVPGRLATLIGVGTAVCGNSAIVATAPVIRARDDEVSFAVATNTLFGTLAVLLYPVIGRLLHFGDAQFGTWAGTAVNDTSQVVAAGFAYSEAAGRLATAVKLTRNALMGLVIVGVGFAYARAGAETSAEASAATGVLTRIKQSFPIFVLGFLAMALLNSVGAIGRLSGVIGHDLGAILRETSRAMILVALAGVGLSTRLQAMRRTGWKPFLVGFAVAAVTSGASLLLIHLLGPAAG